ncbi:hypothetical protein M2347_003925 [Chryseobacterium sp. H1D6B]|uniref:hypothetical protein n=1 Tax=Chryseobacterium sp. H1D6B TaxID=2940588 RepID=UPI0015CC0130|nr:hypothetical protein [Chryseobacterium sp. H1D6B]MDH6254198.1 hypothetical protein [Chryseobacterium sp. H1D6B]
MIETEIRIFVNRELDTALLRCFPDYEFSSDLEKGRKEIRLQLSRHQSEFSTDGWGRQIENPLNETKYLIKKSDHKPEKFSPEIKVLFGAEEQSYYINIIDGINRSTDEKGFLLLNEFKTYNSKNEEIEVLQDKLYKTPAEAFHWGIYKMKELVDQDFEKHTATKKKEKREHEKNPRKMIRGFINSCNHADYKEILKYLANDVVFVKKVNWQQIQKFEGISKFEKYIKSPGQELCSHDFKIRYSWHFDPSGMITIGIKYYPVAMNEENKLSNPMKYKQMMFKLKEGKISTITEDS